MNDENKDHPYHRYPWLGSIIFIHLMYADAAQARQVVEEILYILTKRRCKFVTVQELQKQGTSK